MLLSNCTSQVKKDAGIADQVCTTVNTNNGKEKKTTEVKKRHRKKQLEERMLSEYYEDAYPVSYLDIFIYCTSMYNNCMYSRQFRKEIKELLMQKKFQNKPSVMQTISFIHTWSLTWMF